MDNPNIRIQQIELINFKNIENGIIAFPSYTKENYFSKVSEIIGVYGQNGSGKTSLVDALWIIRYALMGRPLPKDTSDYILKTSSTSELKVVFSIESKDNKYLVFYDIEISRAKENRVILTKENLSYKSFVNDTWTIKTGIIGFNTKNQKIVFTPEKNFKLLTTYNQDNRIELRVSKKLSEENMTSFIFSNETEKIIENSESFKEYSNIILLLKNYSIYQMFIVKNSHIDLENIKLYFPLMVTQDNKQYITLYDIRVGSSKPSIVPKDIYNAIKKIFVQMNIVLKAIIPGLSIDVKNHGKQISENGRSGFKIEFVSIRNGLEIPLRYESDGIKKIISILGMLVRMFNSPSICLVVDELDSGVFEYLLGEILQIINESGKGQLIFTSHNLRPLEILDTNSLVFTTTNPKKRYLKFSNVKSNNNLRKLYYRSLSLGGQAENIYEETNSFDIARAFRVAGSSIDEN